MHHPSPVEKQLRAFLHGQPVRNVSGPFQGSQENVCSDLKQVQWGELFLWHSDRDLLFSKPLSLLRRS